MPAYHLDLPRSWTKPQASTHRLRPVQWLATAILLLCGRSLAADPSNDEQLWLELINRMRGNPGAELSWLVNIRPTSPATWGEPKSSDPHVVSALEYFLVDPDLLSTQWRTLQPAPPLAWNSSLHAAAAAHNLRMIEYDMQSHQVPGEPDFATRITNAGYTWTQAGENVFAYTENVFHGHAAFAIDWGQGVGGIQNPPGHRNNLMNAGFKEIGIAITMESSPQTEVGPLVVTQDLARRTGNSFITGVIYSDNVVPDYFYTPGEGLGGVSVEAFLPGTSSLYAATTTYASGGYSLRLPAGTYDIRMSGGALAGPVRLRNVSISSENVKIDNISSWMPDADGDWTSPRNWSAGVPDGLGSTASLHRAASARRSIRVPGPVTVGTLNLQNATGYTIYGTGLLTLDGGLVSRINAIGPGRYLIATAQVQAVRTTIDISPEAAIEISAPLLITGGLTRTGGGQLLLGTIPYAGAATSLSLMGGTTCFGVQSHLGGLTVGGSNALALLEASQHIDELSISSGRLVVSPGSQQALYAEHLSILSGQLDLNDNLLVVQATADSRQQVLGAMTELVRSGRGSGPAHWTGYGIVSSAAKDDPQRVTGLVVVPNQRPSSGSTLISEVLGVTLDTNAILVRYSFNGDVNLDRRINADDYFRIDRGFLEGATGYANGDFNYDGKVNADDYFLIDSAFLASSAGISAGAAPLAILVPEPGSICPVLIGLMLARRRPRF